MPDFGVIRAGAIPNLVALEALGIRDGCAVQ